MIHEQAVLPRGPVILDIEGTELTAVERDRLRHPLVGGVVLFARHFTDSRQLCALTDAIQSVRPLPVAVDQEGGRVQRFKTSGFTRLPPMRGIGLYWDKDPAQALAAAFSIGYVLATELRAHGISVNFAPVLDLDYCHNEVIGDRAFHPDPQVVTALTGALIDGMHQAGMGCIGKHFPGHGYVQADSHTALPMDERKFSRIWEQDCLPYRQMGYRLDGVMPAHIVYEKVDMMPAGFSAEWLQTILRQRLNYQGIIFSDDLTMEGASVAGDIVARAEAAVEAGCDMVLVCNRPDLADTLLSRWQPLISDAQHRRIQHLPMPDVAMDLDTLCQLPVYAEAEMHIEYIATMIRF